MEQHKYLVDTVSHLKGVGAAVGAKVDRDYCSIFSRGSFDCSSVWTGLANLNSPRCDLICDYAKKGVKDEWYLLKPLLTSTHGADARAAGRIFWLEYVAASTSDSTDVAGAMSLRRMRGAAGTQMPCHMVQVGIEGSPFVGANVVIHVGGAGVRTRCQQARRRAAVCPAGRW